MPVYFMQGVDGGFIKIGYSFNVAYRLKQLQCISPVQIKVLATIEGEKEFESFLHKEFAGCRHHGEWFHPTQSLMDFIERRAEPWTSPLPRFGRRRKRRKLVPVGPPNPVGRPPSERGARRLAMTIKAYPEWKEWLEEFARTHGYPTLASVIDDALVQLAKSENYPLPPER